MKSYSFLGLKCPIPVLKAHKIIKYEKKVTQFEFLCDDSTAPKDFDSLCKNIANLDLKILKEKDYFRILITKT